MFVLSQITHFVSCPYFLYIIFLVVVLSVGYDPAPGDEYGKISEYNYSL